VLPLVGPAGLIQLSFDPILSIGDVHVRLETLGIAAAILVALVAATLIARGTPVDVTRPADAPGAEPGELNGLRADDLLYISVAALPGAVVGGRLGYALLHLDYYSANLPAILDVGRGGLQLSLGVVGGMVTATIVASLLGTHIGRWLHAVITPLLLALAAGKAAMILGGSGQGQPADVSWATAYVGSGPWGSLAPGLTSHPSQAYEALATVVVLLVVSWFLALDAFKGRNGGAFFFGIGLWAVARALVAMTWRDPQVVGPLRADQVISIVIAVVAFLLVAAIGGVSVARGRRARAAGDPAAPAPAAAAGAAAANAESGVSWPDPENRPRI
jgi:prolipoprotein diacylglyceryltransferase